MAVDVNTGVRIAEAATIERRVAGVMSSGYPKTYSILAAFGSQPAISENDFAHLTTPQYNARYAAWVSYLQEQEDGLNVDADKINQPSDYNTTTCPLTNEVIIEVAAELGGNATGGGTYSFGTIATLTASPTDGEKVFGGWKLEGSTEIITKSPIYSFTAYENKSFVAVFRYPIITIGGLDTTGKSPVVDIEVVRDPGWVILPPLPNFALDNHFVEIPNIRKGQTIVLWFTPRFEGGAPFPRLCTTGGPFTAVEPTFDSGAVQVFAGLVNGDATIYITAAFYGQNASGVPVGGYSNEAPVHALSGDGSSTILPNVGLSNPVILEVFPADYPAGKTFKDWYNLATGEILATTPRVVVDISVVGEDTNASISDFGGGSFEARFE